MSIPLIYHVKERTNMTGKARPTCPDCQSLLVPYLYGMPSGPPPRDGGPDDFFVAGCLLDVPAPKWGCRKCHYEFWDTDTNCTGQA